MTNFYKSFFVVLLLSLGFSPLTRAQDGNNCANAIPIGVTVNDCQLTRIDNTGLGNSGTPPTACPGFAGGDIWVSVVMPPSGSMLFRAQRFVEIIPVPPFVIGTPAGMDVNLALYEGGCGSLNQIGCNQDDAGGLFPEIEFSGTPGETYYIQMWDIGNNQAGEFDVCANGTATCTSPSATFNPTCDGNNQFSVDVNITNLGDASSLSVTNSGGAPTISNITTTGVVTVGPFSLGTDVTVTVEHAEDPSCNVSDVVSDLGVPCERIISCGNDFNQSYCYRNNDNTAFLYSSTDGSPLTLRFNSGLIQSPQDAIIIRNGNNASAPILFNGSNGGDLTGLTRIASSGSVWLQVNSDVGGSCSEGSLGLGGGWNWDVSCEGISACNDAEVVTSATTFEQSQVPGNIALVSPSGATQCSGSGTSADLWYSFTAVGAVQYFRATASGDFDPVIEVYESCGGTLLQCENEAGPGTEEFFWLDNLTVGEDYVYRVYHAGASAPSTTTFFSGVVHIPTVQIRAADCSATGLATNSIIRSDQPTPSTLLVNYEFEFTELEAPFNTYVVISPNGSNPQFIMQWFSQVEANRTYEVRTRVRMFEGANLGEWGPVCTISTGGAPPSGLQVQFDGGTFQLCDVIRARPISGSTNYRWVFDDGVNTPIEYNSNNGSHNLQLVSVPGLTYNTSYDVEVFVTAPGDVESTTSFPGSINMVSSVPSTGLNPASNVACGSTVLISAWTQAIPVCAASSYQFRFINLSETGVDTVEVIRANRVISFGGVPGLLAGNTYSVAVRATVGGLTGDYDSECEVSFVGPQALDLGNDDNPENITEPLVGLMGDTKAGNQNDIESSMEDKSSVIDQPDFNTPDVNLKVSLYPNPAPQRGEVNIVVENIDHPSNNVEIEIYDLTGKLLFLERYGSASGTFNAAVNLSGDIPTGVYILRTKIDGVVTDTKKLILE